MGKIKELAEKILEENKDEIVSVYDRYAGIVDGAKAAMEIIDTNIKNSILNDYEDMTDNDRELVQGALAYQHLLIEGLIKDIE